MSNLDRRLRALEASSASSSARDQEVECDLSGLTKEQRGLVEQAQVDLERLRAVGTESDLQDFIAKLPDATKRAIARVRLVEVGA